MQQPQERKYALPENYSQSGDVLDAEGQSDLLDREPPSEAEIWSRRIIIGLLCLVSAVVVVCAIQQHTKSTCVQIKTDCSWGSCVTSRTDECPDVERAYQMGRDTAESNFERGRANVFPTLFKMFSVCLTNVWLMPWIANKVSGRVVPAGSWQIVLWTVVIVAPDLIVSASTSAYTDVFAASSLAHRLRSTSTAVAEWSIGWVLWLWPTAVSLLHLYAMIHGSRRAVKRARKAGKAVGVAVLNAGRRAVSEMRDAVAPLLSQPTTDEPVQPMSYVPHYTPMPQIPAGYVPLHMVTPTAPPAPKSILKRKTVQFVPEQTAEGHSYSSAPVSSTSYWSHANPNIPEPLPAHAYAY